MFCKIKQKTVNVKLQYTLLYHFIIESYSNFENIILPYYDTEPETKKNIAAAFKMYKAFELSSES